MPMKAARFRHTIFAYENDTQIDDILADDTAHTWLKNALRSARNLDPIDVASDAEFLCSFLDARARKILSE